ncbi:hypothetical protein NQ314_002531 [Rhamnusium bicolor]|uniref:Ribosomal RNA-processing protein 14/surfeit locus protein 6 C-terminal domain-containing protein n=1 Tax=Rhamnusium bicolor TaxID=1586634 RepID=A0AAV8ZRD2_9CUCU|nr:hypothetical protein NQ314_002531 [Rhamnusium bicolor]
MQLIKNRTKFDPKKVEQILINENKFITDLFSVTAIPERKDFNEDDETSEKAHNFGFNMQGKKTSRAKSLQELQQRLEAITSKKKLTYKDKLTKKGLKNRMKKKNKREERNTKQKLVRVAKLTAKTEKNVGDSTIDEGHTKPIFNSEDKMVYSKFDFANLEEQKEKIQKLEERGETEKALEIKEKAAWRNALAKVKGQKVKDDPTLLKKSMRKQEQKQRSSKKKWENRIQGVQRAKDERQQKRTENIEKKKKR